MKYYSEITKEFYDTPESCEKAEAIRRKEIDANRTKLEEAEKERKRREEEMNAAYRRATELHRQAAEAYEKYEEIKIAYYRDYPRLQRSRFLFWE